MTPTCRLIPFRPAQRRNLFLAVVLAFTVAGCHDDMYDQPRYDPLERSDFFADGRAARPALEGTVAFGAPWPDDALHSGKENGELVDQIPVPVDAALLKRGRERFDIYCSVCHGRGGDGDGMIVERGYRQPPTYHSERLRGVPVGHFFDVMTNGFGAMPSYASQVPVADRWAIASYIRALQWSRNATVDDLTADQREQLEKAKPE